MQNVARQKDIPCLHVGFSGDGYGEVIWDEFYAVPDDSHLFVCSNKSTQLTINQIRSNAANKDDPCDYAFTRPLMHLLVGISAEVIIRFLRENQRHNLTVTLNDLTISTYFTS